jgi:hypothetical protein
MIRVIYYVQKLNKENEKYNEISRQGKGQKNINFEQF